MLRLECAELFVVVVLVVYTLDRLGLCTRNVPMYILEAIGRKGALVRILV